MKRILCLLCALLLTAGLFAACGGKDDIPPLRDNDYTTPGEFEPGEFEPGEFEPGDEPSGNDFVNPGQEYTDLAEAFSQFNQIFGATWPENEFTKQVPKPKFETSVGMSEGNEFVAICVATVDEMKDYVKDLKRAGFTKNDDTTDQNAFGMVVYSYKASNGRGYTVEVNYTSIMNISSVKITKG